jgi:hypothetical protein
VLGGGTTEDTTVTFPNNSSNNSNGNPLYERSYTGWIIFACVAVAAFLGIYMMSGRNNSHPVATNSNRPAITTPTTTGSGIPVTPAPADKAFQ